MNNHKSPPPCDGCGTTERLSLIIHNVRHRGLICHFCTHCLLSNHQSLFCPICFHVFIDTGDSPLPSASCASTVPPSPIAPAPPPFPPPPITPLPLLFSALPALILNSTISTSPPPIASLVLSMRKPSGC
ncbi:hypothetical protein RIF29_38160 [Crotalaria pallida]|uniref:Uncharacterized protein n=1 Tax=Crotalaria pallida TaxID=3830 RepID=A0AAN9E530_CROPI